MKFNANQITVVIAIAAIISPVIVAIVNDIFTYQLKKKELESAEVKSLKEYQLKQKELVENSKIKLRTLLSKFVSSANKCYQHIKVHDYNYLVTAKEEFADAASDLFIVMPSNKQEKILDWLNRSQANDEAEWLSIITEINSEAPKLLKSINNKRK